MLPKIYTADAHEIDPNMIDPDALYVLAKLRNAGFEAYLVGGSVRDLLIKKKPKDYDISTSALPEEVKKLFQRQCLLIGRRFRLAHIRFAHKVIEVATFRAGDDDSGLIVHDNEWGTPEQDVLRRDFTMNGLFYDPQAHQVIDYVGGWDDIHNRIIRTIGEPVKRFKQDPVRMIRLLKFRARYDFHINDDCLKALHECREEILKSSSARVLEEMFRMLESGASSPFFSLMLHAGLLDLVFPSIGQFLKTSKGQRTLDYLSVMDKIILNNPKKPIDRALLTVSLLYPILESELEQQYLSKGEIPHMGQILNTTAEVIKQFVTSGFSHFPRRISATAGFVLSTQYRLSPLEGKKHVRPRLMRVKEFDLAYKFLKVRALADPKCIEHYEYWKKIYRQYRDQSDHRTHNPPPVRRRRSRHAPSS